MTSTDVRFQALTLTLTTPRWGWCCPSGAAPSSDSTATGEEALFALQKLHGETYSTHGR